MFHQKRPSCTGANFLNKRSSCIAEDNRVSDALKKQACQSKFVHNNFKLSGGGRTHAIVIAASCVCICETTVKH
jgi:hypothetical protein